MPRHLLSAVALLCLLPVHAAADIGPKPTRSGVTPVPAGEDMPGIEVEMAEESVDLLLRYGDEDEDRIDARL